MTLSNALNFIKNEGDFRLTKCLLGCGYFISDKCDRLLVHGHTKIIIYVLNNTLNNVNLIVVFKAVNYLTAKAVTFSDNDKLQDNDKFVIR